MTNPDGSRELVQRASSQDKTLKVYDGAYHDLLHDLSRDVVQADIESWLGARAP